MLLCCWCMLCHTVCNCGKKVAYCCKRFNYDSKNSTRRVIQFSTSLNSSNSNSNISSSILYFTVLNISDTFLVYSIRIIFYNKHGIDNEPTLEIHSRNSCDCVNSFFRFSSGFTIVFRTLYIA